MVQNTEAAVYDFGPFQVDTVRRILLRDGEPVPLTSKAFDTLLVLIRNRDRVLEKEELMKAIWPDSFVEEANLAQHVSALRRALGESASEHRYIATVPGRGYRFVAAVRSPLGPAQPSPDPPAQAVVPPARRQLTWRKIAAASLLLLAIALAVIGAALRDRRSAGQSEKPRSLAILPFRQLTPMPANEYLGVGLADAVVTRLSNLHELAVRPTSSVLKYIGSDKDPRSIGRELHVDAVLDGRVQTAADKIRITLQLIRVDDGRSLWAETFDESNTGIFAIEDSASARVTEKLALHLGSRERRKLARGQTQNVDAYRDYLQGRYAGFRFTPQGLHQAIEHFNRAIALDPSYALAYAGLADAYTTASDWVLPPHEALAKAEAAARKAIEFDDDLAEAHSSLAHALMHQGKFADAGKEFDRALSQDPNDTAIYFAYSEYLSALGKEDEAVAELKKALKINPLSTEIMSMIGWPLALKHDNKDAVDFEYQAIKVDPQFWMAHMMAGYNWIALRQFPRAIAEFENARALNPDSTLNLAGLATAWAQSGNRAEALKILADLQSRRAHQYVSPMDIAQIYANLGENDQAFEWLHRACQDGSEMLLFIKDYPPLESLHTDPRFGPLASSYCLSHPQS
jgi:DNA-binding winged helix-turn-helix (wHTH) protein/TolB-like protein/Tfp pilus assembly protein PilF